MFPSVIPHSKAGCSRVTHPSATRHSPQLSENSFGGAPFDLHVLSTPPAFILSQDQTLNKMVFKQLCCSNQSYWSFPLLQNLNWRCPNKLLAKLTLSTNPSGASCLSRCLIYKVHAARVQRRALSYHTSSPLSRTFFDLFDLFLFLNLSFLVAPRSRRQLRYDIIGPTFCQ